MTEKSKESIEVKAVTSSEEVVKKDQSKKSKLSLKQKILIGIGLPVWTLLSFILAGLAVGLVIGLLVWVNLLSSDGQNEAVYGTVVAALVYALSIVIAISVPLKLFGSRTTKEDLGLGRLPNWKDIWLTPVAFIGYTIAAAILLGLVAALFPGFDADEVQETGFENLAHNYEYILAFITLVLVAPVAEEVLVRGYLYGKMRAVTGVVAAAIVSSLLFSLMHLQWNVALNVLPLGIAMVILRETTGSIWAGIFLHMLKNGIAYYLLFVDPSILDTMGA